MDLIIQFVTICGLIAIMTLSYWRWVKPFDLSLYAQGLMLLSLLTLYGGLIGGIAWWQDIELSFSWDLPPVASRMLGAAGWSFAIVNYLAIKQPTHKVMRLMLGMLFVYLVPLTLAILFFHLDRFDFSKPIVYAFFVIVLGMDSATLLYVYRQPSIIPEPKVDAPPSPPTRLFLWGLGSVLGLWGLALFITAKGPSDLIWLWQQDLLTSRLIAVMLLTIATACWMSFRSARLSRLTLIFAGVYGVGVAAANAWNYLADKPVQWLYVVSFLAIGLLAFILVVRESLTTKK